MNARRASRNALAGVAQTLVSAGLMFVFYRAVYAGLGAESVGIWSVVLASTSLARLAELGFTGSAVKYTAGRLARGARHEAALVVETTVVTVAVALALLVPVAYAGLRAALPAFVEPSGQSRALSLLPYACASLWASGVAGAVQSGLDGAGRIDQRNGVALVAQALYVALGLIWMRPWGLVGLAAAQLVQAMVLASGCWVFLRRALPEVGVAPVRWHRPLFREMLGYSTRYQGLGVLRVLYEPTTKALLSRYGGLEAAGIYEMASLAVTKLRALLVSAQQALTPEVAGLAETAPERLAWVYARANALNWYVSVPAFVLLGASGPLLSHLLTGSVSGLFIAFNLVLAAGWFANTLGGPAFFVLLGTGEMRGLLAAHAWIGLANAVLGWVLGGWLGALGVAAGWGVALAVGTLWMLRASRRYGASAAPPPGLNALATTGLIVGGAAAITLQQWPDSPLATGLAPALAGLVLAPALWRHPLRRQLLDLALNRRSPAG